MSSQSYDKKKKNQCIMLACQKALYPNYKFVQFVEELLGTFYSGHFTWVTLQ